MKRFAIIALSILVLAQGYGFSQVDADVANVTTITVSVGDSYQQGDEIGISGLVSNTMDGMSLDPMKAFDVLIKVTAPNGNLVTISQATPNADGTYAAYVQSGESWKYEGVYTVTAYFDQKNASASFVLSIPDAAAIEEVVEAAEEVAEAAEAVAGEVVEAAEEVAGEVIVAAGGLACGTGTHEADGFCIPDGSDSFGLTYDSASTGGLILTASIAFGIAVAIIIVLRLIGKAGRSR